VPLGSYLMCFRFLQVGWRFLKTGELPHNHHDEAHVEGLDEQSIEKSELYPAQSDAVAGGAVK